MTTVVALAGPRGVWMSADTGTNVFDRRVTGARKIHRVTAPRNQTVALLGISGSASTLSVARAALTGEPVKKLVDQDPDDWAYSIAAQLTRAMVDTGLLDSETGQIDSVLLLGVPGHLWTIDHHMAIRMPDGIGAVGSGEAVAVGALDALMQCGVPPEQAVARAAEIAVTRDRHSLPPVQHEFMANSPALVDSPA